MGTFENDFSLWTLLQLTVLWVLLSQASALTSSFKNEFSDTASGDPTMPFRLIPTFSAKGIVSAMRLGIKLSQPRGGLEGGYGTSIPPSFFQQNKLLNVQDIYGNRWRLREAYRSFGFSFSFIKQNVSLEASLGDGAAMTQIPSMSESFGFGTDISEDPLCNVTSTYRCCYLPNMPWAQYLRYSMVESESISKAQCIPAYSRDRPHMPQIEYNGFSFDYVVRMSLFSASELKVRGHVEYPTNSTINSRSHVSVLRQPSDPLGNPSITMVAIQSMLSKPPMSVQSFLSHPKEPFQLCSRDHFASEPFAIPPLNDSLGSVGLSLETYLTQRPCSISAKAGYYTSRNANNSDSLQYYIQMSRTELFGNMTEGFGCRWRSLLALPSNGSSPMRMSLECDEILPHAVTIYATLPPQIFQPLFPLVALSGKQGVLDLRLGILRASINVWATSEGSALVTSRILQCILYPTFANNISKVIEQTPLQANLKMNISSGHTERMHMLLYHIGFDASLDEVTYLNRTVGHCIVRVDQLGVRQPFQLFPQLRAINISIIAIRSKSLSKNPQHTFMQTNLKNNTRERRDAIFYAQHYLGMRTKSMATKSIHRVYEAYSANGSGPFQLTPETRQLIVKRYFPASRLVSANKTRYPTNITMPPIPNPPSLVPTPQSLVSFMNNPIDWPQFKEYTVMVGGSSNTSIPQPCRQGPLSRPDGNTSATYRCTYWSSGAIFGTIASIDTHPFLFDNGTWKIDVSDLAGSDRADEGLFSDFLSIFDTWQRIVSFGLFVCSGVFISIGAAFAKRKWSKITNRILILFRTHIH